MDFEPRRADPGRRDKAGGGVTGERDDHQLSRNARGRAALRRREAAGDEPADDCGEGRALDQRVGRNELLAPQVIGQDAVLDRAEQRRDAAKPEQGDIEQHQRRQNEPCGGDHLHAELCELQPPRDESLVVRIGDFASEGGKRDRRQDEHHRRDQDFRAAVLRAEAEQDQHGQHVADEIVVKRRKELAPEQRREAPRGHQGAEHEGGASSRLRVSGWTPKYPSASSARKRQLRLLQEVADADQDLLGHVVLLHRQAGLRIDQQIRLTGVEVTVADVERRARSELEAEADRERPGELGRSSS